MGGSNIPEQEMESEVLGLAHSTWRPASPLPLDIHQTSAMCRGRFPRMSSILMEAFLSPLADLELQLGQWGIHNADAHQGGSGSTSLEVCIYQSQM